MRVAVFGAGGLGGYFGGRLARGGADVHLIARGAHLEALREGGLTVQSAQGDFHVDLPATDDPAQVGVVDVVLFTVKSYDTQEAAARLAPLLRAETGEAEATAVISFQNGIDNEDKVAAAVGPQHVLGGVSYIFVRVAEPGTVRHSGGPSNLIFGELDGQRSARTEAFLQACRQAEINADIAPDIRLELWSKYVFLCAMAGMTAAVRLPVGEIRSDPAARQMLRTLLEEGWELARAEGVALPDDYVERRMSFVDGLQPEGYSSLYNDLITAHRMELDALHGELLRRAERSSVAAPATRAVYAILSPWARRNWP